MYRYFTLLIIYYQPSQSVKLELLFIILPLWEVTAMRKFIELQLPGLFNAVFKTALWEDSRMSEDGRYLREQRTVALLHIIDILGVHKHELI